MGRASIPSIRARVSAVFMLVSDAPIIFGKYVTRVRIGVMSKSNHLVDCTDSGSVVLIKHSVAAAVMMGYWQCFEGGARPPSTAINRGEHDCLIMLVIG